MGNVKVGNDKIYILTINSGSSSMKFSIYRHKEMVLKGQFERVKSEKCTEKIVNFLGDVITQGPVTDGSIASHSDCLAWLISFLAEKDIKIGAIGHRVVHGGLKYSESVLIDQQTIADLEKFSDLAPLHQPHNLAGIHACGLHLPDVPQVACFDTAFHHDRTMIDRVYPIDRKFAEKGILAYGFHGLSYTYIATKLAGMAHRSKCSKVAVCHLGNGASISGMVDGKGVTSSMGFTALEGLMMGTRCGSIDPGVIIHLIEHEKMEVGEVKDLLYQKSGLLGLSGISSDVRDLEKVAKTGNEDAVFALEKFSLLVAKEIGYMLPSMNGLDTIVFTAGIGEKSAHIREMICNKLSWLGLELDPGENARNATRISSSSSQITVYVIPTDEESVIARDTAKLVF